MDGARVQIVAKNRTDILFNQKPEVTFFKNRLPRHTAFSFDTVTELFNRTPNFGEESVCKLSKPGNLISDLILKIEIPSVLISKNPDLELISNNSDKVLHSNNYSLNVENMILEYNNKLSNFSNFIKSSMVYWRNIKSIIGGNTTSYTTLQELILTLETSENDVQHVYSQYNEFNNVKIGNIQIYFNFDILNKIKTGFTQYNNSIYNETLNLEFKEQVKIYLDKYKDYMKRYYKYLIDTRDKFIEIKNKDQSLFYRFSWVKKLGCAIIENIEFNVGGKKYDFFTDVMLETKYELTTDEYKKELLDKMLGNIDVLTSYDDKRKPSYTLLIPLPFWFSRYKQQSFSCEATKYQDIEIYLKLRDLESCCYFEGLFLSEYDTNININELVKIKDVSLYAFYIYLTDDIKRKYANNEYEALIELNDQIEVQNLTSYETLIPLEINTTIKEFHWVYRKKYNVEHLNLHYEYSNHDIFPGKINTVGQDHPYVGKLFIDLTNEGIFSSEIVNYTDYSNGFVEIFFSKFYNGTYKILMINKDVIVIDSSEFIYPDSFLIKLYDNYKMPIELIKRENPIIYGTDLVSPRDSTFYTCVMPYSKKQVSSKNSIRNYIFSRNTKDFQPSGSLNFGVIKNKKIKTVFNENLIDQAITNETEYICNIMATTYNFVHFHKGFGTLLYK